MSQGDWELLDRFVTGRDQPAFSELVRRHGPLVMNVCRRILHDPCNAEDAFQAVFLVLARKANSIHRHKPLAAWLHGVAANIALDARRKTLTREKLEREAAVAAAETPSSELNPVLDEELNRLSEKYRSPLVLCYLEGLSNEEASKQLGWPKTTVWRRLTRAQELLRSRLSERGVFVSVALLASLMVKAGSSAAVGSSILVSTVKAAASGLVSAHVDALFQGGLKVMMYAKLKMTASVLVAVTMAASGGVVAYRALASEPVQSKTTPAKDHTRLLQIIKPLPGEYAWRDELPWVTRIKDARQKAAAENKPILVNGANNAYPLGKT